MNQAALNVVLEDWRHIKKGMSTLIREFDAPILADDRRLEVWARSLLPMFLPLYYKLRARALNEPYKLPTPVSGLFKVMLDVPTTLDLMLAVDWASKGRPQPSYFAEGITAFAEDTGILNNGEWTCAGPPRLITQLLRILADVSPEQADGDLAFPPLETGSFTAFSTVMIQQYALTQAFLIVTATVMEAAFAALALEDSSVGDCDSAYEIRRRFILSVSSPPAAARRVVKGFIHAARQLNVGNATHLEASARGLEHLLLDAVTGIGDTGPSALLEKQLMIEQALRQHAIESRVACCEVMGVSRRVSPPDFSFLERSDYPTVTLSAALEDQ